MSPRKTEDHDNPEWTAADFKRAVGPHALSEAELAAFPKTRGRPKLDEPKEAISLRLDRQVVNHLRSRGPGWQTRVNETLAEAIREGRL